VSSYISPILCGVGIATTYLGVKNLCKPQDDRGDDAAKEASMRWQLQIAAGVAMLALAVGLGYSDFGASRCNIERLHSLLEEAGPDSYIQKAMNCMPEVSCENFFPWKPKFFRSMKYHDFQNNLSWSIWENGVRGESKIFLAAKNGDQGLAVYFQTGKKINRLYHSLKADVVWAGLHTDNFRTRKYQNQILKDFCQMIKQPISEESFLDFG